MTVTGHMKRIAERIVPNLQGLKTALLSPINGFAHESTYIAKRKGVSPRYCIFARMGARPLLTRNAITTKSNLIVLCIKARLPWKC